MHTALRILAVAVLLSCSRLAFAQTIAPSSISVTPSGKLEGREIFFSVPFKGDTSKCVVTLDFGETSAGNNNYDTNINGKPVLQLIRTYAKAGTYTFKVTAKTGCTGEASGTFTIKAPPPFVKPGTARLQPTNPAVNVTPALAGPAARVLPNAIGSVEMIWKGPYLGNIIRFNVQGVSTNVNAKCVVAVTYSRAPNFLFPEAFSVVKEFTLPTIPTLLETTSMDKSGDWTIDFKPVKECTGSPQQFKAKVLPTQTELDPKILGVGGKGNAPALLADGMTGQISIAGHGDLKNCKVELTISGPVSSAGVKIVNMNGALLYQEPFTVTYPTSNAPGFLKGSSMSVSLAVKPVSGCTLQIPNMQNTSTGSFQVWNSF